ncbi:MAG: TenA family protein [Thermoleophilia bacterium]
MSAAAIGAAIAPVTGAILEHPFVRGLTDGSLHEEAFRRYVVQDGLFLRDYARALALCGARAADGDGLRTFCVHAAEAVAEERELHERLFAELGVDPERAAAAEPTPTCLGYTSFLLRACAVGERHEGLGAVLPCYWIYRDVGLALARAGSPDPRYAAWIATYGGEAFGEAAQAAIDACDRAFAGLPRAMVDAAARHALTAARYEWMFWDSAWRGECWPPALPLEA